MATDALDDEERAAVEKIRAARQAAAAKADDEKRAILWNDKGEGADVPYGKAKAWLQKNFGIDLDAEPVQDEPDEPPADDKPAPPAYFGRRKPA
jgi:hypothetical protein